MPIMHDAYRWSGLSRMKRLDRLIDIELFRKLCNIILMIVVGIQDTIPIIVLILTEYFIQCWFLLAWIKPRQTKQFEIVARPREFNVKLGLTKNVVFFLPLSSTLEHFASLYNWSRPANVAVCLINAALIASRLLNIKVYLECETTKYATAQWRI